MVLENYEMHLPSYSIGQDIYPQIKKICAPYGNKVLIIGGAKAMAASLPKLEPAIRESGFTLLGTLLYGSDCTYAAIDVLASDPLFAEADMVFGVGGGKALDTCKCLCIERGKPLFTFPTIASNCAAVTSVSIMYNDDGTFLKPHFFLHPAEHSFIDTEIAALAPEKYMWAGIGDTYAKYYEAKISARDSHLEHFTALGVALSSMCMDPLVTYGPGALKDNRTGTVSYELEQTVLAIVVTTGIVSILLTRDFTPDYNSGLAHAIFYALTAYPITEEKHLHGEVVGFGVLFALLVDGQEEEFKKIHALNRSLGLPTSLEDIEITREQFEAILPDIGKRSDVTHYPYEVTPDLMRKAWEVLDRYNQTL